jgi:hypothetical protein
MAQSYNPYPRHQGGFSKITDTWGSNEPPQLSEQQMLAQQLKFPNRKFRSRSIMPQQQLTEQERMMVIELVRQGMNEQQAMQQVMSMRNN